jgi:hypothetical protein
MDVSQEAMEAYPELMKSKEPMSEEMKSEAGMRNSLRKRQGQLGLMEVNITEDSKLRHNEETVLAFACQM